jgi:hypothetical protein
MRVLMSGTQIGSVHASATKLFDDGLFPEGGFE